MSITIPTLPFVAYPWRFSSTTPTRHTEEKLSNLCFMETTLYGQWHCLYSVGLVPTAVPEDYKKALYLHKVTDSTMCVVQLSVLLLCADKCSDRHTPMLKRQV